MRLAKDNRPDDRIKAEICKRVTATPSPDVIGHLIQRD
jgi:hypothetical protein